MDVTAFMGSLFLKVDAIRNRPREVRIKDCRLGQFDKLDLHFEDGDKLSPNATSVKTALLARSQAPTSDGFDIPDIKRAPATVEPDAHT